jgi:hypothetical protein
MTEQNNDRMELLQIFNKTTNLDSLWERAAEIQKQCTDYTVNDPRRNARYSDELTFNFCPVGHEAKYLQMSDHAFSQLCAKIGVPVRYMKQCLSDGEVSLVSDNMNTWIEKLKSPLLVRTYNNKVRGVLSDKFSVLDTPDIINVLQENLDDYKVKATYLNEERFHARLIQKDMLDIAGEDLFAGIQIDSSDVGRSVLKVRFMIFKQVCTNGLTVSKGSGVLFEQKHIGITSSEFDKGLRASLSRVPELVASISTAIQDNRNVKLTKGAVDEMIAHAREHLTLTEDAGNKIIDLMNDKYGKSRWGLINGITEVAQDYTLERRLELESYAGNLLIA